MSNNILSTATAAANELNLMERNIKLRHLLYAGGALVIGYLLYRGINYWFDQKIKDDRHKRRNRHNRRGRRGRRGRRSSDSYDGDDSDDSHDSDDEDDNEKRRRNPKRHKKSKNTKPQQNKKGKEYNDESDESKYEEDKNVKAKIEEDKHEKVKIEEDKYEEFKKKENKVEENKIEDSSSGIHNQASFKARSEKNNPIPKPNMKRPDSNSRSIGFSDIEKDDEVDEHIDYVRRANKEFGKRYSRYCDNKNLQNHTRLYQIMGCGKLKAFIIGKNNVYIVNIGVNDEYPTKPMLFYPKQIIPKDQRFNELTGDKNNCIQDDLIFDNPIDISGDIIDEEKAIRICEVRLCFEK